MHIVSAPLDVSSPPLLCPAIPENVQVRSVGDLVLLQLHRMATRLAQIILLLSNRRRLPRFLPSVVAACKSSSNFLSCCEERISADAPFRPPDIPVFRVPSSIVIRMHIDFNVSFNSPFPAADQFLETCTGETTRLSSSRQLIARLALDSVIDHQKFMRLRRYLVASTLFPNLLISTVLE